MVADKLAARNAYASGRRRCSAPCVNPYTLPGFRLERMAIVDRPT